MTNFAALLWNSSIILRAGLLLISLTVADAHDAHSYLYEWSYDEMTRGCKPYMSVQVKIDNETRLHNVTFTISTGAFIDQNLQVHTHRNNFTARNRVPCLYHGTNTDTGDSVFASQIRGVLNMTFKHKGSWYRTSKLMNSSEPALAQQFHLDEETPSRCYSKTPPRDLNELKLRGANITMKPNPIVRKRRALTLQSFQGAAPTKILELVVVLDRSFVSKAGSEGNAVTRVMQITNYINGVYQTFSLRVVLTNIIIWSTDAFTITNSPDDTLNSFTLYKTMQIGVRYDTVILLSAVQWNSGTTLGLAWMNGLCDRLFAAGIVADKYSEAISTAWTLAHEVGHNLGFSHVEDVSGCTCSKTGGCIMNAYLSPTYRLQVLDWATCSVDEWNSQVNTYWRTCLADAPDSSYSSSHSAVCGNGILEAGEQCDCGPVQTCTSKCCDASTCLLKSGALCASGPCCDWNSCTLRYKGEECRAAVGVCDVPETCSGTSEWCPSDDKVANGVDCASGQAFCYNGQCKTTDAQCQTIFSTAATTASSTCFTQLNTRGDVFGHCDMRLQSVSYISGGFNRNYSFAACAVANTGCGLLHCYQSTSPGTGSTVTISSGVTCYSNPRMDFSPSGLRSPSFVPDGAKCGTNSMCINSSCTQLSTVRSCPTCPNCNGRGVLTAAKLCFCNSNSTPPYCNATGCGGSVTSPLACFDLNRTTARPWTDAPTTSLTGQDSSGTQAYILGLPMWQFIVIVGAGGGILLLAIIIVLCCCCSPSRKQKRRAASAAAAAAAASRVAASPGRRSRHPPPPPQQPQPQPPRPQHPPPRPPTAPATQFRNQQHQNLAFRPDAEFNMPPPPPYQLTPTAPPPPSYGSEFPSVYSVQETQQAWPEQQNHQQRPLRH